jgi:hypothetical protein
MNDGQETNAVIEIMKGNDNPVAEFFSSPSNTPETDDQPIIYAMNDLCYQVLCVDLEFARRLERERDEATKDLEFRRELYKVQEQYLETARRERDEAREALREAWLAMDEVDGTDRMVNWQNKNASILEGAK